MKLSLLIVCVLLFTSCSKKVSLYKINQTSGDLFKSVFIDGCEYVEIEYGPKDFRVYKLIHKDNCENHKPNERNPAII